MATYTELLELSQNEEFRQRVMVACFVAANAIWQEDPLTTYHAERRAWAKRVFEISVVELSRMHWVVLVVNQQYTKAQILAATDSQIQAAVNDVVNFFAVG